MATTLTASNVVAAATAIFRWPRRWLPIKIQTHTRWCDVWERTLFDAVDTLHKNELLDLIQIYDGAFYCVARPKEKKWKNKKHFQTNWRHHTMPFKSQTYSTFGVSVFFHSFISLFLWLLLSPLCSSLSSRCLANQMEKHITITATEWRWNEWRIQNNVQKARER